MRGGGFIGIKHGFSYSNVRKAPEGDVTSIGLRLRVLHVTSPSGPCKRQYIKNGMRFPTMWYFDICRLRRASAVSF